MWALKARKAAWTPVTHMDHSSCPTAVRPPEKRHSSKALLNQRELWENYLKWKVCYANVLRDCGEKCREGRVYGCGGWIVRLSSQFLVSVRACCSAEGVGVGGRGHTGADLLICTPSSLSAACSFPRLSLRFPTLMSHGWLRHIIFLGYWIQMESTM